MVKDILVGMLFILSISAGILYYFFSPHYATQLLYNSQTIKIQRDQHGIPHIYASSRRSYLYGLGYVMGEDRLFQCTIRKILAQGRLSQFLGEKTLPVDVSMRDLGLQELGQHIADKMKEEYREGYDDFDTYAKGINDATANRLAYPIEFHILGIKWEKYTVADIYTLQKLLEWSVSHNLNDEYTRSALLTNYTVEQINKMLPLFEEDWAFKDTVTVKDHDLPSKFINHHYFNSTDFEALQIDKLISMGSPEVYFDDGGSNAWVVSGQHTESGKTMLVADPHLQAFIPSHWYQFRTTYTFGNKTIQFAGVSPPGIPTPYGKNQYFGLACTIINTDTQDGFRQKIEGNQYFIDGEWKTLKTRTELIKVKEDKGVKVINHTVRLTHRGPVMNYLISSIGMYDVRQEPVSLSWTGHNEDYMSVVHAARNIEILTFEEMKFTLGKGSQYYLSLSVLANTADGHIGYAQFGVNPKRPKSRLGNYISDGTTTKHDWLGTIPYTDRLSIFDPKDGYLVTCNNRPASSQFLGGYFDSTIFTARATRLEELIKNQIASGRKITSEFAISTLYDTVDIYCKGILPEIIASLPRSKQFFDNFTCDFKSSSYQATMYEIFFFELWKGIKPLPQNNISYLSLISPQQALYNYVHKAYNGSQAHRQKLEKAWNRMTTRLQGFFKTKDVKKWEWGLFHRDYAKQMPLGNHPVFAKLYNRESSGWGNQHTVNVGRSAKIEEQNFATTNRANLRTIYDFGGPSFWVSDAGVSQNLLSSHYDDQWKLFISQKLLPLYPEESSTQAEL